jgi:general secretion pathway protein I
VIRRARAAGFTLIEVLVALAILAIAMAAIVTGIGRYSGDAGRMREMTLGLWVAHNRLTEIELQPGWPEVGTSDGELEMAGREWRWDVTVAETPDPRVRRVNILVRVGKSEDTVADLTSYLAERRP